LIRTTIQEEEMQTPFEGGCMCGEVRYRCEAEPGMTYYCHCEDCRRGSGSAFHVGLGVSKDAVTVLKGEPKSFRKEADSGRGITRVFCPTCGSPLFTYPDVWPDIVMIKAGSVDEPELFEPNIEIYTDSKVSWAQISPTVESYPKGRA
jgi:hypothetical protein